jgi:archaellum component FlaC
MLALPGRLWTIWRSHSRRTPPQSLGGSDFSALLAANREGGLGAVEKLMTEARIPSVMQANGYTAIARQLMPGDRLGAAEAAQRAYALDPKPYRLKWLAFRLHEAGQVIEAAAMLDMLPADMQFSASEDRQASQLRYEAHRALQREAKQRTKFDERRADIEKQLNRLASERDDQARQLGERCREVELLKESNAKLEEAQRKVTGQYEKATSQVAEHALELEVQNRNRAQLEQDVLLIARREEGALRLLDQRAGELDRLKQVIAQK